jgi:tetratricopeptide (TPR) repeat protein
MWPGNQKPLLAPNASWRMQYDLSQPSQMLTWLGKFFLQNRDFSRSIREFERAISIRPDKPEGYYNLSLAYRRIGQKEKSAQLLEKFNSLKAKESNSDGYQVLFSVVK